VYTLVGRHLFQQENLKTLQTLAGILADAFLRRADSGNIRFSCRDLRHGVRLN
jgi:hypothetical protein